MRTEKRIPAGAGLPAGGEDDVKIYSGKTGAGRSFDSAASRPAQDDKPGAIRGSLPTDDKPGAIRGSLPTEGNGGAEKPLSARALYVPEVFSRAQLVRAAAILAGATEADAERMLAETVAENGGEVVPALVDLITLAALAAFGAA